MPTTKLLRKALAAPAKATPTRTVKLAPEGLVTAIVAVTNVVDSVEDVIVAGAFAHTLKVRRPKVCEAHSWERQVGRVLHAEEWMPGDPRLPKRSQDGKPWPAEAGALVATMQYNLNTQTGRDAFEWVRFYAESNEASFSIGYKVPEGKSRRRSDGVRVILQVDVFEFSHVLHGAAALSMALEVKNHHGLSAGTVAGPALGKAQRQDDDLDDEEPESFESGPPEVDPDAEWDEEDEEERRKAPYEAKTAAHVLLEAKGALAGKRGNAETLRQYWAHGEGAAKIGWGTPGDFNRCTALVSEYMGIEDARGYCQLRHHDALGIYTSTHAAMSGKDALAAPEGKGMNTMKGSYEDRIESIQRAAGDLLSRDGDDRCYVSVVATYDTEVIVMAYPKDEPCKTMLLPYSVDEDGNVALEEPQPVELSLVAEPGDGDAVPVPTEDVEDVTVVGPMLAKLEALADMARFESKAGAAVREHAAALFGLEGKSAAVVEEDEAVEDVADEDTEDGPIDDEPVEPTGEVITANSLPEGEWDSYRKTAPIEAVHMDGPFSVETREGVVHSDGGWLAVDSDGFPYPIADEEFENVYEPAPDEGKVEDPDDAVEEEAARSAEEDTLTDEPEGETVTLNPDEHFDTMAELDAGEDGGGDAGAGDGGE